MSRDSAISARSSNADFDALLALGRRLHAEGQPLEEILGVLRTRSESIIDSIKVVRVLTGWSLTEAKPFVHESAAWADRRDEFDRLHAELARAWRELEQGKDRLPSD